MTRLILLIISTVMPTALLAAAGGVGGGFGAEDWIGKWPVLLAVFAVVVGMTSFFTVKIRNRAKVQKGEKA